MALIRGPLEIRWNGNIITDIEEIDFELDQDTDEHTTLGGSVFIFDGPIRATVTVKLLRSDIPTLAIVLPQYFVANGQELSTGETVNHASGAIDVLAASCDTSAVYGPLDIISCGNPGQVTRIVNARTKIDSAEFDPYVATYSVQFIGEPASGDANVQMFMENSIAVVS